MKITAVGEVIRSAAHEFGCEMHDVRATLRRHNRKIMVSIIGLGAVAGAITLAEPGKRHEMQGNRPVCVKESLMVARGEEAEACRSKRVTDFVAE